MSKFEIFRSTLPVMMGYVPLGLAFGIYGISQDLPVWALALTSLLIYAGSVEFVLIAFIVTHASLVDTFVVAFLLNFRHFFYTMSLLEELRFVRHKIYAVYALTDETFALLKARAFLCPDELSGDQPVTPQWLAELDLLYNLTAVLNHSYWVAGVVVGAVLGASLKFDFSGVEFSLTALFAMLTYEVFKANPQYKVLFLGFACAFAGLFIFPTKYFLFGTLIFGTAVLLLFRKYFERPSRTGRRLRKFLKRSR